LWVVPDQRLELVRGLTLTSSTALVVGTVIGTGVFLKSSVMAQELGSPSRVLLAWFAAGVFTLFGALTYAELGALLPSVGGDYAYLRLAYGETIGFLYGWMRCFVGSTGTIASLAVGFSIFLSSLVPLSSVWMTRTFNIMGQTVNWQFGSPQVVAVSIILFLSVLNCLGIVLAGALQSLVTAFKVLGIMAIVVGCLLFSKGGGWQNLATHVSSSSGAGLSAFATAMLAALWAFDGWNQMPMVASEVRDPKRNIPIALVAGMAIITICYLLVNFAYAFALPIQEIATSSSTRYPLALPVATKAAQTFVGPLGERLITILFLLSCFGALNGSILTCARVPFAMAQDGLFLSSLGRISSRTRVPVTSIAFQAIWASVLAMSGTFDQLTDCVIFTSWIFYGLATASVFILRRKIPLSERIYRTPGYPYVPIIFVTFAVWLLANTLRTRPVESVTGLVLLLCGLPVHLYYRHYMRKSSEVSGLPKIGP
jgi:APA family basic amino acid/polyamine antiporter